jgi:hypothetical protein
MKSYVAQMAAFGRAAKGHGARLHPVEDGGELRARLRHIIAFEGAPALVERLPHILRERGAHRLAVGARLDQTGTDGDGIVRVEDQMLDHVALADHRILFEQMLGAGDADDRLPLLPMMRAGQDRHTLPHGDQPRGRLGPLQIARQPEKIVGGPAQHGRAPSPIDRTALLRPVISAAPMYP